MMTMMTMVVFSCLEILESKRKKKHSSSLTSTDGSKNYERTALGIRIKIKESFSDEKGYR